MHARKTLVSRACFFCLQPIVLTTAPQSAWAEDEDYFVAIYVADADGSNLKLLTNLPEYQSQGSPCWSADGRYIAFDAYKSQLGQQFYDGHIIVVNADGSNPRDLGLGILPSLSPKGHRVAYCRHPNMGAKGVWIMDLDDPESAALVDERGWGAEWSPDGTRLAYTRDGNLQIYSLIEGTVTPVLGEDRAEIAKIEWNFCWSADSRRIAFKGITADNRQVLAIADVVDEKPAVKLAFEGTIGPAIGWRPGKNEILIEHFGADRPNFPSLYRIDLDSPGEPVRIIPKPVDRRIRNPAFSPDGKRLALSVYRRQPGDD